MTPPPTSIDGTDITGATIDGTDVEEITIDGQTVFTSIRDSEAPQKLIHRFVLNEQSPPFSDSVGNADSTSTTGTTRVTGNFVGGAAREGDGVDDQIVTTPLGDFGSTHFKTGFAIALTIDSNSSASQSFCGLFDSSTNQILNLRHRGRGANNGDLDIIYRDTNTDIVEVFADDDFTNQPFRVVYNVVDPTNAGSIQIWANQIQRSISINLNQGFSTTADFQTSFKIFNVNDNFYDGTIDDLCIYDSSLTSTEIQSYVNPF